ncbi:MAG: GYD domain-containing protein [SAR202 cluster bacterium]|nr:GYD domain-containing protein [SAR202 cluster bacterium]
MATYIQLLILTPEGRARTLEDPEFVLKAQQSISITAVTVLGTYGVLGQYDFINIVDAPNESVAAKFSIELGVKAGAHITTLPAIPIARLENVHGGDPSPTETSRAMPLEGGRN